MSNPDPIELSMKPSEKASTPKPDAEQIAAAREFMSDPHDSITLTKRLAVFIAEREGVAERRGFERAREMAANIADAGTSVNTVAWNGTARDSRLARDYKLPPVRGRNGLVGQRSLSEIPAGRLVGDRGPRLPSMPAILTALLFALPAHADENDTLWVRVPAYSAACDTCCEESPYHFPARVAKVNVWLTNYNPAHPFYRYKRGIWGLTYRPGVKDGKWLVLPLSPWIVAAGESALIEVVALDSLKHASCPGRIAFRR